MNNNNENKVVYLRIDDILPNRFQPRENFEPKDLEELADSIKEHGVIQPIIVRKVGDKYELIAGERRTKASALAGLTTIPAIIRDMDDKESAKISLLENLQRKNLSAIEEARTYKRIKELENITQEELARTLGKSQPAIANKLRLLALPEEVQDALLKNQISERHARSLLNVKDNEMKLQLLDRIRNERLTVRELDNEIKKLNGNNKEVDNTKMNTNFTNSASLFPDANNFNNTGNNQVVNPPTNFYEQPSNNFDNNMNSNYRGNFSNMGLNDYQSVVNNNMFNNIPNNFQNTPNSFNNIPTTDFSNQVNTNSEVDYSSFDNNTESYMESIQPNNFSQDIKEEQSNNSNNFSSLGSMFDNSPNTFSEINETPVNNNQSNQNLFISNIQEDNVKKQENQFLPNFDTFSTNNNTMFPAEGFVSNNEPFRFQNGPAPLNQNMMNQNNSTNSFNNFSDYQMPVDNNSSFNVPYNNMNINNYGSNQGGLFNQPLNIVDVPQNNMNLPREENMELETPAINQDNSFNEEENQALYDSLLSVKPVPINPNEVEDNQEVKEEVSEEENSEVKETNTEEKNDYINIDHVKTLFSTRDAVLELKKTTDRIKKDGINIDTEEIDFDDVYQIVIKIKKELG